MQIPASARDLSKTGSSSERITTAEVYPGGRPCGGQHAIKSNKISRSVTQLNHEWCHMFRTGPGFPCSLDAQGVGNQKALKSALNPLHSTLRKRILLDR